MEIEELLVKEPHLADGWELIAEKLPGGHLRLLNSILIISYLQGGQDSSRVALKELGKGE